MTRRQGRVKLLCAQGLAQRGLRRLQGKVQEMRRVAAQTPCVKHLTLTDVCVMADNEGPVRVYIERPGQKDLCHETPCRWTCVLTKDYIARKDLCRNPPKASKNPALLDLYKGTCDAKDLSMIAVHKTLHTQGPGWRDLCRNPPKPVIKGPRFDL